MYDLNMDYVKTNIPMVSIKDFQDNPSKYMNSLPIVLSRYNKPIGMVATMEQAHVWLSKKEKQK